MAVTSPIKVLALGRLLSAIGSGFTAFYAPIFFVNVVHLLPSAVGAGLGAGSLAGVAGRVLSGNLLEGKRFARKGTILLATVVQCIGSFILATTSNFPTFVAGSILMGFGVGLYWPATQTFIADTTGSTGIEEAVALTLLADYAGLAIGVILGGLLISFGGNYRFLFIADGLSFVIFSAIVCFCIKESQTHFEKRTSIFQGWSGAFHDARLRTYVLFNIQFTAYISMVSTASAGAAIGPPIGLAVLGQSPSAAHQLWLGAALSTVFAFCILLYFEFSLKRSKALHCQANRS